VADDALGVYQKQTAQRDRLTEEDTVFPGDALVQIGDQRILDIADAAVFQLGVLPGQVGELGIHGNANHLGVAFLELVQFLVEGQNLGRADKGEIQGIEKQYDIFPLEAGESNLSERIVRQNGIGGEIGCFLGDECCCAHVIYLLWR
jgi:hypothetical protein